MRSNVGFSTYSVTLGKLLKSLSLSLLTYKIGLIHRVVGNMK